MSDNLLCEMIPCSKQGNKRCCVDVQMSMNLMPLISLSSKFGRKHAD